MTVNVSPRKPQKRVYDENPVYMDIMKDPAAGKIAACCEVEKILALMESGSGGEAAEEKAAEADSAPAEEENTQTEDKEDGRL